MENDSTLVDYINAMFEEPGKATETTPEPPQAEPEAVAEALSEESGHEGSPGASGASEIAAATNTEEKKFTQADLDRIVSRRLAEQKRQAERKPAPEPVTYVTADGEEAIEGPQRAEFKSDAAWIDARYAWKRDQEEQFAAQETGAREFSKAWQKQLTEDPTLDSDEARSTPLPPTLAMELVLMGADAVPLVAALARDPELAERIHTMTPTRAMNALTRAALTQQTAAPSVTSVAAPVAKTKLPAPARPVGGRSMASEPEPDNDYDAINAMFR